MDNSYLDFNSVEEGILNLQALNDRIRIIEMTRSGERIKIFSLLIIIAAAIYLLFQYLVEGVNSLLNPQIPVLSVYAIAAIAIFLRSLSSFRRATLVKECNALIEQRKQLEEELHIRGAFDDGPDYEALENQSPAKEQNQESPDLIQRFANKQKRSPKRLSLRNDSE